MLVYCYEYLKSLSVVMNSYEIPFKSAMQLKSALYK